MSPEDAERLGVEHGDMVRVTSRRGTVEAPVYIDRGAARRRGVHDAAFPRRRRDEPAHDQRDRSAVGHRRVQGVRGARRAGARRCRRSRAPRRAPRCRWRRLMDLHLRHAAPTDDERAAVDALLGPPRRRGMAASAAICATRTPRSADAKRANSGICCCPRCRRCRRASAGSARRDSTMSARGSAFRRPTRGASRRSTRCCRRRRARRACSTSATTSRVGARARTELIERARARGRSGARARPDGDHVHVDPNAAVVDAVAVSRLVRSRAGGVRAGGRRVAARGQLARRVTAERQSSLIARQSPRAIARDRRCGTPVRPTSPQRGDPVAACC